MADLTGHIIGRYRVLEPLGQGGMATVYKVYDTRLEREVALKVIRVDMIGPALLGQMLKRFEREAKSLAQLDHPNIIKIHDFGEHEGAPYLVMQYITGGTLKQKTGKPMPYVEAAHWLAPVANALEYAHSKGIIHRDIKPANILINWRGDPMLSDFGIAKLFGGEQSTQLTATSAGIGTPEYMAPEQGYGDEIDHRADIYALGVMFYELVTGHRPYEGNTPLQIIFKHINAPLPSPKNYVPDLPEAVEKVILKALAKNPDDRYQHMIEFADALEQFALDYKHPPAIPPVKQETPAQIPPKEAVSHPLPERAVEREVTVAAKPVLLVPAAQPRTPPQDLSDATQAVQSGGLPSRQKEAVAQPPRRRSFPLGWLAVGFSGLLVIAVVVVVSLLSGGLLGKSRATNTNIAAGFALTETPGAVKPTVLTVEPSSTRQEAAASSVTPAPTMTNTPAAATYTASAVTTPSPAVDTATPTARSSPATSTPDLSHAITKANIDQIKELANWNTAGSHGVFRVAFSPDGKTLVVATDNGIYFYDTATQKEQQYLQSGDVVTDIAYSADGKWFVSSTQAGTVSIWNVDGYKLVKPIVAAKVFVNAVAISPDGKLVASGAEDKLVKVWTVPDGNLKYTLSGHNLGIICLAFSPDGKLLVSGAQDRNIRIWNMEDGSLARFVVHDIYVRSVTFSPDGTKLASASSSGGTIRIWNPVTGESLVAPMVYKDVLSLDFSADGTPLVSSSYGGIIKFWDPVTGNLVRTLNGFKNVGYLVAFSMGGRYLAFGSYYGDVRLWGFP